MQIVESEALFNFINSIPNEQTRQKYQTHIKRFLRDTSISEFLKSEDIEKKIIEYLVGMRHQGLSHSYIFIAFAAIKHLCFMNDVIINTKKISKFIGERAKLQSDRPYTGEEILKVLNTADLRMRVIVLLLVSTGVRIGALPALKEGHIRDRTITVYAETPDKYTTFMTPECRIAIDAYLEFRKRSGEKITPDSFILREKFDMNDLEQVRKRAKQVKVSGITNELLRALVKCGLRTVNHTNPQGKTRHEVKLANGFRKFFTNALIEADIKTEHRWLLEGHHLKANDDYYVRASEKSLADAYERAVNALTINPENRLKRELDATRAKQDDIAIMKFQHEKEMAAMREEVKQEMKQQIAQLVRRLKPEIIGEVFS